jgi:hypothetical protein
MLYPKQRDAIYDPARYSFIEASTKSGKTVGCILWLKDQALQGRDGYEYWWVAPIREQAKIAYRRMKRYMTNAAGVPTYTKKNDTDLAITLPNGTRIVFKGSDRPDGLYGEDVHAAVIDEASRCKEDAWTAVRSTLTKTRGKVRIIGNVKGRKNWAYRMGQMARQGVEGYAYHRITALDAVRAGVLEAAEILDARRVMTNEVFAELYMAIATDDGSNPFGIKAIRECVVPQVLEDKVPVVWGWDLGRKQDWTVGIALNDTKQVCRMHRFKKSWPETVKIIGEAVGRDYAVVDATGVGDAVVQQLQTNHPKGTWEEFIFTNRSKQRIVEGLAHDVQGGDILFPAGVLQDEMEAFEYVYTKTGVKFSAPEGMHDDAVCALAMARKGHIDGNWRRAEFL